MSPNNLMIALTVLVATGTAYFGILTYRHRSHINALRKLGFPMPAGWSWLFGHSLVILKYTKRLPPDANVVLAMKEMSEEFADTEMFLMDMWPGYPTSLIVFNPEALHLISQKWNLPRPPQSLEAIKPIVGGPNIVSMNGSEWKIWRSLLNPGFSSSNMANHVPFIVDCVQIFCDKLRESVGKGIISLDEYATRLTFDVIMKVTLDSDVNYQRSEHILPTAFDTITKWHSFWDVRILLNPLRPFIQSYNGNQIKNYIRHELEKRFAEMKGEQPLPAKGAHSVISLALDAYTNGDKTEEKPKPQKLDPAFIETVTNQVRLFLFAGNDTTSSTIAFCFHMLAKHPEAHANMQQEHDKIFGVDTTTTAQMLKDQPALLNQCTHTIAFIKETLRLYPPAANMRRGQPGKWVTALNGQVLPTEGFNIICVQQAVHENSRVWIRPREFIPERWLVGPDHELHPPSNAYRPFDVGSRTCIGQPLTMLEIKVVLILSARTFSVVPAYEEWDRLQEHSRSLWQKMTRWIGGEEINTVYGDRAYQSEKAGTHPADGYPCRVSLAQ